MNKYPGISAYVAFADNPLLFIDPDGRDVIPTITSISKAGNQVNVVTSIIVTITVVNLSSRPSIASVTFYIENIKSPYENSFLSLSSESMRSISRVSTRESYN